MTPEEINAIYNALGTDLETRAADDTQTVGDAQRAIGGLAAQVASPSGQTAGLANYTYNRTINPAVQRMAASLVADSQAAQLNAQLNIMLKEAQDRYKAAQQEAQRRAAARAAAAAAAAKAAQQASTVSSVNINRRPDSGSSQYYYAVPTQTSQEAVASGNAVNASELQRILGIASSGQSSANSPFQQPRLGVNGLPRVGI